MRRNVISILAASLFFGAGISSAFAFGAIAVNDGLGTSAEEVGYAVGWGATQKEAEANAVKDCLAAGNEQCKVAVWFEQCGAYVGDRVHVGAGFGATQDAAEKMALEKCPNCKVIVSDCQ